MNRAIDIGLEIPDKSNKPTDTLGSAPHVLLFLARDSRDTHGGDQSTFDRQLDHLKMLFDDWLVLHDPYYPPGKYVVISASNTTFPMTGQLAACLQEGMTLVFLLPLGVRAATNTLLG